MPVTTVNPATGEPIATYAYHAESEVEALLARAEAAFHVQRRSPFAARAAALERLADLLEARQRPLAEGITREMGKPIAQAEAEVAKCARACRYVAAHAEAHLADEVVPTEAPRSVVQCLPLGVVVGVMPWNFPLWQVIRFAAPALAAGNTVVLKHAESVLGCGEALAELFREAGFPEGAFAHLILEHERFERVVADRRVAAVSLTGSVRAGRAVAALAGKHLKPAVLELGGSDPFLVLADADVEHAAEVAVRARFQNTGQSCIAAKRFLLEAPIAEAFTERFLARVEALRTGDPMDPATDLGPLAREDLRRTLHDQVERTRAGGARLLVGGAPLEGPGWFYSPTVLADVPPGGVPFTEELFGPAAALTVARDAAHAVELANATPFGLGAAVFTGDTARGEALARELACGCVFVNEMVQSHPALPFGGVRESGYGRELGREGTRAFVNVRTLWVA